jgi:hypothetical protein
MELIADSINRVNQLNEQAIQCANTDAMVTKQKVELLLLRIIQLLNDFKILFIHENVFF